MTVSTCNFVFRNNEQFGAEDAVYLMLESMQTDDKIPQAKISLSWLIGVQVSFPNFTAFSDQMLEIGGFNIVWRSNQQFNDEYGGNWVL